MLFKKKKKKHLERCNLHWAQRIKLLELDDMKERNKVKPTKTEYQLCLLFVIYADFKSVLWFEQDWCGPWSLTSFITQYQYHVPFESCIYVKCSDGQNFEPLQVNIGGDFTEKFLDQVLDAVFICRQHLSNNILMKWLNHEQWKEYNNDTNCPICAKPFKSADKKVHNHDHLSVWCRGPAHNT